MTQHKIILSVSVCVLFIYIACDQSEYEAKKKTFENWMQFREEIDIRKKNIYDAEHKYRELLESWNQNVSDENKLDIPEHLLEDPVMRVEFWIKQRLAAEKGVAYEDLIAEIESLNDKIARLQLHIDKVESESGFSEPYVVRSGDTHFKLALQFLSEKHNIELERVKDLIRPVALWDELLEGFLIYFLYDKTNFYTSVSQGSAQQSPNKYKSMLDKRRQEKFEALAQLYEKEKNQYQQAIERIDNIRLELEKKAKKLTEFEDIYIDIMRNLEVVKFEADSLDKASNSVYYVIVSKNDLIKRGLHSKGLWGIGSSINVSAFDKLLFDSRIDIRDKKTIYIGNLNKGQKVTVYSQGGKKLKKGVDYKVKSGGFIELRKPNLFRQENILIVLS